MDPAESSEEGWENELSLYMQEVLYVSAQTDSWYNDINKYLQHGTSPSNLNSRQKRALRLRSSQYQLINDILFRKNYDSVFLRCLKKQDAYKVLAELHDGPAGGHFASETTAHKILRVRYYWPRVLK